MQSLSKRFLITKSQSHMQIPADHIGPDTSNASTLITQNQLLAVPIPSVSERPTSHPELCSQGTKITLHSITPKICLKIKLHIISHRSANVGNFRLRMGIWPQRLPVEACLSALEMKRDLRIWPRQISINISKLPLIVAMDMEQPHVPVFSRPRSNQYQRSDRFSWQGSFLAELPMSGREAELLVLAHTHSSCNSMGTGDGSSMCFLLCFFCA